MKIPTGMFLASRFFWFYTSEISNGDKSHCDRLIDKIDPNCLYVTMDSQKKMRTYSTLIILTLFFLPSVSSYGAKKIVYL